MKCATATMYTIKGLNGQLHTVQKNYFTMPVRSFLHPTVYNFYTLFCNFVVNTNSAFTSIACGSIIHGTMGAPNPSRARGSEFPALAIQESGWGEVVDRSMIVALV